VEFSPQKKSVEGKISELWNLEKQSRKIFSGNCAGQFFYLAIFCRLTAD
jgi:hypothetical protein